MIKQASRTRLLRGACCVNGYFSLKKIGELKMLQPWPFDDPENVGVITTNPVDEKRVYSTFHQAV
jgi:hypothetical protein